MKRVRVGLQIMAITAAMAGSAPLVWGQQPLGGPTATRSANIPLPSGPFASWPPDIREQAICSLRFQCMIAGGMAFGNYQGPKQAAIQDIVAFISLCVAAQMPEDWPDRAAENEIATSHHEDAKRLDPNIPDPALIASALQHKP